MPDGACPYRVAEMAAFDALPRELRDLANDAPDNYRPELIRDYFDSFRADGLSVRRAAKELRKMLSDFALAGDSAAAAPDLLA